MSVSTFIVVVFAISMTSLPLDQQYCHCYVSFVIVKSVLSLVWQFCHCYVSFVIVKSILPLLETRNAVDALNDSECTLSLIKLQKFHNIKYTAVLFTNK